jgi:hypothetical protein
MMPDPGSWGYRILGSGGQLSLLLPLLLLLLQQQQQP